MKNNSNGSASSAFAHDIVERINLSGVHMEVGENLTGHVKESLSSALKRYISSPEKIQVIFEKDQHHRNVICHIAIIQSFAHSIVIKGDAKDRNAYLAFDFALVKVINNLRKYNGRVKGIGQKMRKNAHLQELISSENITSDSDIYFDASKKVIDYSFFEKDQEDGDLFAEFDKYEEMEYGVNNPVIILEKPSKIEKITVTQAVINMELQNLPALIFINQKTNKLNFIYFRKDNNISWIALDENI